MLTGCWDIVNIEDRGFIVGSAMDIDEETDTKQPKFIITNQIAVPSGMIAPSRESGGGERAFLNYTSTGTSIYKMEEKVSTVSSKVPYYEHLSVLVISEDVAKQKHLFSKLLDTYIRDVNLRRGIKVVVSKGEAKKLLEFTSPNYNLPARHIEELLEKGSNQVGFLKPVVAGDIEEFHLRENSYILPFIHMDTYLEYESGAVFHGPEDKMIGIFDEDDMQGFGMILGEDATKIIEFPYKEETLALDAIRSKSKMKVDQATVNDIAVSINIEIEGVIKELMHQEDLTKSSAIESIQIAVSNNVKKSVENVIKKAQDEFGTDVFGIWQLLEMKHYDVWQQVKDEWEEGEYYFKDVTFDVNVKTEIYSTGSTNKTD